MLDGLSALPIPAVRRPSFRHLDAGPPHL